MKLQTVLFDLGNVLFPFNWDIAIKGFSLATGRSEEEILAITRQPDYAILFYEYGTGRISTDRFVDRLNEAFQSRMSFEGASRIWCSIFTPDLAMLQLLKKLRKHYRLFILSDTDPLHWTYLDERWGLEEQLSGAILSYRYGNMKGDPGVFAKILSHYCILPERALFIDDLPKNIEKAQEAGVHTILHRSAPTTIQSLKALGFSL